MARKRRSGISGRVLGGTIGGVVIAGVVIAVFFFGVGSKVLPQSDGQLQIPIPDLDEINEINDEIIEDVTDIQSVGLCDDGSVRQEDPNNSGVYICPTDPPFDDDNTVQGEPDVDQTQDETNAIENTTDNQIEIPESNVTDTSTDPTIVQVCDQLGIPCGSEALDLQMVLTKIDKNGQRHVVTETFNVPRLAFLVEDTTNIDFSNGFLEIELFLLTENNRELKITDGEFDILVSGNSIFETPVKLSADGTTQDGKLQVSFVSPSGALSPKFTFNFDGTNSLFPNEQSTPFEIKLLRIDVLRNNVDQFSLVDQVLYSMDIVRDDIRILIEDEETGEIDRVYPTDSKLIIKTVAKTIYGFACSNTDFKASASLSECNGLEKQVVAGTTPPPTIGSIQVLDSNGNLFASSNGGSGTVLDADMTRNANYTVMATSPTKTFTIGYGKSQETKTYQCSQDATVQYKLTVETKQVWGFQGNWVTRTYYTIAPSGITPTTITCNYP